MLVNFVNYIMFILVMVMSHDIVSYTICMFEFLCKITTVIQISKFVYFSYIGITISVYGIMFIDSGIINKLL